MKQLLVTTGIITGMLLTSATVVMADGTTTTQCQPIYGGGQNCQTITTTKGGTVVYPVPQTTKTPPTGAEVLSLFGLIPGAVAGFVLRKKSL